MKPETYEQAMKKPSRDVRPGCGDGRSMWCGRVHDFCYQTHWYARPTHDFRCWQNHTHGCPNPKPEAGESRDDYLQRTAKPQEGEHR